jgi:hypothetical protein
MQWDPKVSSALNTLWYHFDLNKDGSIDEAEYMVLHKKLWKGYMHMHNLDKWSKAAAKVDWQRDCEGLGCLNYVRFRKCFFEMTDRHTESINPEDYHAFLDDLLTK